MLKNLLQKFWSLGNPHVFLHVSHRLWRILLITGGSVLAIGLFIGVFIAPVDYRQGAAVRIMYLHVPAALMAVNGWFIMVVCSIVWLIRRHWVSALAAQAAAPVGLLMALITVLTGALWGKPIWGTYWVFDPRLTSFLILCGFYCAYIALWYKVGKAAPLALAADITSVLCLVGTVFAVLSRYAVLIWAEGLHQGASLSLDKANNVDNAFYIPLLFSMAGLVLLCWGLIIVRTRTAVIDHRMHCSQVVLATAAQPISTVRVGAMVYHNDSR